MKKSCCICKHSVEVKYSKKHSWGIEKYVAFFCIAAPPTNFCDRGNILSIDWSKLQSGRDRLLKYSYYPAVARADREIVAPCSLCCPTDKKIEKYKKMIEDQKKAKQKAKEEEKRKKAEAIKSRKEAAAKRKKTAEESKKKRIRIRLEAQRIKKRIAYQKAYRIRKKEEVLTIKAEAEKLDNRFEILDL